MNNNIHSSIACNLDQAILQAALPLFESGEIEAIEWSFDTLYNHSFIPDWFVHLLHEFGKEGRLIGHGVYYSLFSGRWSTGQQDWLNQLEQKAKTFQFQHITEHFGFMTGENFHTGAPLNIPFTASTLAIGIDRLKRLQLACKCPVGLENLAFSYSLDEVKKHGDFLNELIEPVNGFIILDLHNLYCQACNFDIGGLELMNAYPLERVREVHISGGSWEASQIVSGRSIRRDTHDDAVPEEVFRLLEFVIHKCPNLQFVVLEQLGGSLQTEKSKEQFRSDFRRMKTIVQQANEYLQLGVLNNFLPKNIPTLFSAPIEELQLYAQQMELSSILETSMNYADAIERLKSSSLANTAWNIENWQAIMLETAIAIAQKWKNGFS